jgi:alpha-ribazole phosphatase/probable phosphoglycerate mutase
LGENTGLDTSEVRPPGGESFADVWNRVRPFLDEIETLSGNVLVVTHGGTAGVIIARMILATVKTCRSFRFGNTGLTELERRNDNGYMIRRLNDLQHLGEEFER